MEDGVRLNRPGMGEKWGLKGSSAIDLSHRAKRRLGNDPPSGVIFPRTLAV